MGRRRKPESTEIVTPAPPGGETEAQRFRRLLGDVERILASGVMPAHALPRLLAERRTLSDSVAAAEAAETGTPGGAVDLRAPSTAQAIALWAVAIAPPGALEVVLGAIAATPVLYGGKASPAAEAHLRAIVAKVLEEAAAVRPNPGAMTIPGSLTDAEAFVEQVRAVVEELRNPSWRSSIGLGGVVLTTTPES